MFGYKENWCPTLFALEQRTLPIVFLCLFLFWGVYSPLSTMQILMLISPFEGTTVIFFLQWSLMLVDYELFWSCLVLCFMSCFSIYNGGNS